MFLERLIMGEEGVLLFRKLEEGRLEEGGGLVWEDGGLVGTIVG